jgi:hypothetical protein
MKRIFLLILIFSAGLASFAQFEKIIQPSDLRQQTIITEPITLRKGYLRTGIGFGYRVQDKYFDDKRKKVYRPTSLWGAYYSYDITLQYGISDRFEIDIYVPLVNNRMESYSVIKAPVINDDFSVSSDLKSRGFGDCILGLYYQIIPEKVKRFTLTIGGDFTFPTGRKNITDIKDLIDFKPPTGEGIFAAGARLFTRKIIYPYSFSSSISYYYNFSGSKLISPSDEAETKFKTGDRLILTGSFSLHLNEWIVFANEINYFHQSKGEVRYNVVKILDPSWDIDYLPRLVFQVRRFRISEFVMIPLFGKNLDADPKYSISVQYTF